ncbi:MAG: hypothetical protein NZ772_00390 [Cyanobacteria bacterium]|nr:hypothetical protein [Cyanobacteriota bacterium]MDW8199807.1 hypothetical protein [Cyanobacteriota bacterium SKYGB_h_bin112]
MVDMIPEIGSWLVTMADTHGAAQAAVSHLPHVGAIDWFHSWLLHHDWTLLQSGDGQFSQDLAGSFQRSWNHFVKTGQVWAMLFGIILGYMIKQFTTFG